jgi:hypothetical protein
MEQFLAKDEAAIKSLYYDEMSAALAEATSASRVVPFCHWVRTGGDYAVDVLLVSTAISEPDFGFGVDPGRLRGCPLAHLADTWR